MNAVYQDPGPCPCGRGECPAWGTKLNRDDHVVGCNCPTCNARGNQRKGRKGEVRRHAILGGRGFGRGKAPNDEHPHTYPLVVTTQDKVGSQVPASFVAFTESDFYRRAMAQAVRKVAIGSEAYPALYLEPESGGTWLVVDISPARCRRYLAGAMTKMGPTP